MAAVIDRRRLGERIYEILLEEVEQGRYPPGHHLAEAEICSRLKVSRTPVREALFKLEQRGLLVSRPNQGFFVAPCSSRQVMEHYPILGVLEALAVRSTAAWPKSELRRLESINRRLIRKGSGPSSRFEADLEFHQGLVGRCGNPALLGMIETARTAIRRWDGGRRRGLANPEKAYQEHDHIISRLAAGELESAARQLEAHWKSGVKTVTDWIAAHQDESPGDVVARATARGGDDA